MLAEDEKVEGEVLAHEEEVVVPVLLKPSSATMHNLVHGSIFQSEFKANEAIPSARVLLF